MKNIVLFFSLATTLTWAGDRTKRASNPIELGAVSWYRHYDAAREEAKKSKRDLFVLFQEVPG